MKNFLIFTSAGNDSLEDDYKNKVFISWELYNYDSVCCVYNPKNNFKYDQYFDFCFSEIGNKYPLFLSYYIKNINNVNKYNYVAVMDEDLLFNQYNTFNYIIENMCLYNIDICSISASIESAITHKIMRCSPQKSIWITDFCEMGMMVFSQKMLKLLVTDYYSTSVNIKDFGFDHYICNLAKNNNLRVGIIKHFSYYNPKRKNRRDLYRRYYIKEKKRNELATETDTKKINEIICLN